MPNLSKSEMACNKCGVLQPVEDYYITRGKPSRICKTCTLERQIKTGKARRLRRAQQGLRDCSKAQHGMTDEEFVTFMNEAECAVCGSPDPQGAGWHVDHDHSCCPGRFSCGKCIRGILCGKCNMGIGLLGDTVAGLKAALEYMEAARAKLE